MAQIDSQKHVNDFYDMHDIGDLMQSLNFGGFCFGYRKNYYSV